MRSAITKPTEAYRIHTSIQTYTHVSMSMKVLCHLWSYLDRKSKQLLRQMKNLGEKSNKEKSPPLNFAT